MPDPTEVTPSRQALLSPLPGILPVGGISILAGAPCVGKTALLAGLLRDIRDGRPIFGRTPNKPPAIGFINADRSWEEGAGLWFDRVGYPDIRQYSMVDDESFSPARLRRRHERIDMLLSFIDRLELPPYSLVNVDPIGLFLGGNLNDFDTCGCACFALHAALRIRRLVLLATAHCSKVKADKKERYLRLEDGILGSQAIRGYSDTLMYLASPEETGKPYFTFVWHPHASQREVFQLEQDEQGLFHPYTGVDNANQAKILRLFPEEGSVIAFNVIVELAQQYPLSRSTVARILEALVESQKVTKVAYGVYCLVVVH